MGKGQSLLKSYQIYVGQCATEPILLDHLKITFSKEGSRSAKIATYSVRFEFICENTSNKLISYHNIPSHLITVESQPLQQAKPI
jgi:hypothetical protein